MIVLYYVYAIKSVKCNRIYVGLSKDPNQRLNNHNLGLVFSTKGFRPWKLIYVEKVGDRKSARIREKYLKSGSRKEYLRLLINKRP